MTLSAQYQKLMKSRSLLACLLASAFSAVATQLASTNSLVITPPPVQIVTCREDVDVDAFLKEFHLRPTFIYRGLNGFAAKQCFVEQN